jgi:hypothetical protein
VTRLRLKISRLLTSSHEWWGRRSIDQKIALWIGIPTVILAFLALVVAVVTPEIRLHLGLDHASQPEKTPEVLPREEIQKPVPAPEDPVAKPIPTVKPRPQKPLIATAPPVGNGGGARAEVPGPTTVVNQGPGSVAQIGNGNSAIINNNGPTARHLTEAQKTSLIECLRSNPGKFSISAVVNNSEAYNYANEWRDVFLGAGWEIEHKDIPIQIFMIGGGTWSGVRANIHDSSTVTGQIAILEGSPEKHFYNCGVALGTVQVTVAAYRDMPTGVVRILVSDRPQLQPQ